MPSISVTKPLLTCLNIDTNIVAQEDSLFNLTISIVNSINKIQIFDINWNVIIII
jgi:hypothetical protein